MPRFTKCTRRYKRAKATYLLKYHAGCASQYDRITNLKNISAGGLCFLTNEKLPQNSHVRLAILLPTHEHPIEAEARVVRSARSQRAGMAFSVGVTFTDISDEDRNVMSKFVRHSFSKERKIPLFVNMPTIVLRH